MYLILFLCLILILIIYTFSLNQKKDLKSKDGLLHVSHIPGKIVLPLIGTTYYTFNRSLAEMFEYCLVFFERCYPGPVKTYRGPHLVVHIYKAEQVEVIANSQTNISKNLVYNFMRPWLGNGLLISTGSIWHSHRKMITPAFHFKILDIFTEVFFEKTNTLISILKTKADGSKFDIKPIITNCTLDIICDTAMGVQVNAQKDKDNAYCQAIQSISLEIVHRMFKPWLYSDFIWKFSNNYKETQRCLKVLHNFTDKVIRERRVIYDNNPDLYKALTQTNEFGQKKRLAFLDVLLNANIDGQRLTDEEIREEVDTFMFEKQILENRLLLSVNKEIPPSIQISLCYLKGHDTTTVAICWALYMLGNHIEIQEKVYEEINNILGGSNRAFTKQDIVQMKYLECVIKETLRLYPSVPIFGRHLEADVVIDKYLIPKGVDVSITAYVLHRDPEHFPNPEKFDPDRFLPENSVKRHPYAYIPFSAGPRNCIGQKFAMIEEKVILSSIIRHFKVKCYTKPPDFCAIPLLILKSGVDIQVSLTAR